MQEVFATTERMAANAESDVLWLTEGGDRLPPRLCVAPLQVWGPMREKLLSDKTVVMTSATLMLGGDFSRARDQRGAQARRAGRARDRGRDRPTTRCPGPASTSAARSTTASRRSSTSPATCRRPAATAWGSSSSTRSPSWSTPPTAAPSGLFSSRRAAETAAEAIRERLPHLTTLAQGDAQLPELAKQFVDDPHTCLFGTLSLWQGLDVPGETCQLVLIDRIPFPRPDDPLMSARQRAVERAGGNGFMQVAATHAALLLAQGSGRLIRTTTDRGVVAVLDPRLATARYGGFLKASLPPMWPTTDPQVARAALARLATASPVG